MGESAIFVWLRGVEPRARSVAGLEQRHFAEGTTLTLALRRGTNPPAFGGIQTHTF
jgi:hypothetical protein